MRTCHTIYLNSPIMQISKAIFVIILLFPILNIFSQGDSDFIVNDVDGVAEELKVLSNFVSKTVVIHSDHVFMGEEGQLLKQQLEEITGLLFTTQN